MGRAYTLDKKAKCGECKNRIREGDLYTIIYADDGSGKVEHLLCDNCEVDESIQEYRNTGEIGSRLATQAALANMYLIEKYDYSGLRDDVAHFYRKYKKDLLEIADGNEKINRAICKFEEKHWLPYVKKYWNKTVHRGHTAKVGSIKIMMWGSAGRVLITLQQGNNDITMIFSDEKTQVKPNGGQQGIHAPHSVALDMIEEVTKAKEIKFKDDKEVRLAGL